MSTATPGKPKALTLSARLGSIRLFKYTNRLFETGLNALLTLFSDMPNNFASCFCFVVLFNSEQTCFAFLAVFTLQYCGFTQTDSTGALTARLSSLRSLICPL
ncbi:hypothetical protein BMETH_1185_1 [methanotrophic bacterial endosymbiont of Bathymodiolus sp.]|nr:hypothetical protein BMETH_1185_1 [methanotrophic bacterial endosymbiont of Bathymodiolus sp.]